MLQAPGININYMAFRTSHPPFDNSLVRQAVSMAINRKAIVESLYQGQAVLANGALPPFLFGYDRGLQPHPYVPEKAKQLLRQAGYATK